MDSQSLQNENFYVVGVGASAGGLEALEGFCSHIPPDLNCAYVVVTHLDPTHKSMMSELLSRHTSLHVKQIESGDMICPGVIYIIPPNRELAVHDGRLVTIEHAQPRGFRTPINTFFNSLANEYRNRAIAVILSGSGTDGSESLNSVKAMGGFVMVQNPDDAKYSGMPTSAIATGVVDCIESAQALPEIILRYARKELIKSTFSSLDDRLQVSIRSQDLLTIFDILKAKTGHDFRSYKSSTLLRRLVRRIEATKAESVDQYIQVLKRNSAEVDALFNEFLINVTRFFRDENTFSFMETEIIPDLVSRMTPSTPLRVWVAGCSTGEEVYSIAMLIKEQATSRGHILNLNLFATDIDAEALALARVGNYPSSQVESQVSQERIGRFFTKNDKFYKISKTIRDMVIFSQHDITRNPPLSKIDMVCCRNVMIYLSSEAQQKSLSMFHYALKLRGYLVLGPSESLGAHDRYYEVLSKSDRCYRKNGVETPALTKYHVNAPYVRSAPPKQLMNSTPSRRSISDLTKSFFIAEDLPPTAVIDSANEVVHFEGNIEGFFKLKSGSPSLDIFSLLDPRIHTEIRATIFSVAKNRQPVRFNRVKLGDSHRVCNIVARPLIVEGVDTGHTVISFVQVSESDLLDVLPVTKEINEPISEEVMRLVKSQSEDLEKTKLILSNVVKDAEATYQELSSSNEELMSTNEELQSTTQELETSREELQSLNEELETVNAELRHKVDELTTANNDISNLMVATEIGAVFLDQSLCVKNFTPAACRYFNLIHSDVGRSISHLSHHFNDLNLRDEIASVLDSLVVTEKEVSTDDGHFVIMRILPYRTTDNQIDGVVLTLLDVTSIHSTKAALQRSESQVGALLSAVPDAFIMISADDIVLDYRVGSAGLVIARESIVGRQFHALTSKELFIEPDSARRLLSSIRAVIGRQGVEDVEVQLFSGSSALRVVEARVASGGADFAVCFFRDVTDKRESEHLRVAKDTAERVSRAKSEFIANMSHELRTPLNGIMGFAEVLKEGLAGPLNADQAEYIENIYSSGSQLLHLVNEILDLAKIEAESLVLEESEFPLHLLIHEVVKRCQPLYMGAHITVDCSSVAQNILVFADRRRLGQVFLNLLGNSIKFARRGGKIAFRSEVLRENEVVIRVEDNGIGIPRGDLERVFGRFEQVIDRKRLSASGTGIGLALVKSIVELHGGTVKASLPGLEGKGVTFSIFLPHERNVSVGL